MVTPDQILILQETFEHIALDATGFADRFYTRLFDLNPQVRQMFRTSMAEQGQKLMDVIDVIVNGLWSPEEIRRGLEELGARHVGYGVQERHYALVGAALLWALERDLGPRWTPEARDAWTAAYALIAQMMLVGASNAASQPRRKRVRPEPPAPKPRAADDAQPGEQL